MTDFPRDYRASRNAFLAASRASGADVRSFEHPLIGSDGSAVFCGTASFGARAASRVLIVMSGTHGVEGLCGAGMQLALLRHGFIQRLDPAIRLVFVHALNPHGFLDLRRTNEHNVDLNRNFVDHESGYPADTAYAEVHPMLLPDDWDGPSRAQADAALAEFVARRGAASFQAAVSRGQYSFPDGLFYGGRAACWSNLLWRQLLREYATHARYVAVVDFHSGLGERGACELICGAVNGSAEHRLARQWFGEDIVFPGLTSSAPSAVGYMGSSIGEVLPHAASALVVAEVGTVAFDEVFHALRADNWLHARGKRGSRLWHETKDLMERAFVGRDSQWQDAVAEHAVRVCRRALAGLLDTADQAAYS